MATDGEVGHVGELGHGHVHVVLNPSGQSRLNPDVNSLIFNSYAYIRNDRVENSDPVKINPTFCRVGFIKTLELTLVYS